MLNIVLFQPDIPQNTGNIGRLCAFTGCRLHLIHPLGFTITDKHLRRAGMDYWRALDVQEYADWAAFEATLPPQARLWLYTTHATRRHWDASYAADDYLVFGKETAGLPDWLHASVPDDQRLTIPRFGPQLRSLNLATSVGIATYEALRQLHGASSQDPPAAAV